MLTLFIYSSTFYGTSNTMRRFNVPTMCTTKHSIIQGDSLRTWSFKSPSVKQVQVTVNTNGRPLDTQVELWEGPSNTPYNMRVFIEDGRPFNAVIGMPRSPNTIAIRNAGPIEFPIIVDVKTNNILQPTFECTSSFDTIQGGAIRTYPFKSSVKDIQVFLKTSGRPLNSRIELLQGSDNNKQVIELYTQNGLDRPFFCTLSTQGIGSIVRIINTAPIEFPLMAGIAQYI